MKKKLLPFILGCAMVAAMPLGAHANLSTNTTVEYANEIPTSGSIAGGVAADESQNGFTEYNDGAGENDNTLAKVFTNSDVENSASGLGNTRNSAGTMQGLYAVTKMNEQKDYRKNNPTAQLSDDLGEAASADPDDNEFSEQTNDTEGTTDLETSIPEFDMKIPASTVLPLGAKKWRIGNVEINGRYFVRPDKVKLQIGKTNFHGPGYDGNKAGGEGNQDNVDKVIAFDVTDGVNNTSVVDQDRYFFQDGTTTKQDYFPYAYTTYTSTGYENGFVSEINETHQVWLNVPDNEQTHESGWKGKTPGKYTGSITFAASVVTDDNASMYGDRAETNNPYYPGEPNSNNP